MNRKAAFSVLIFILPLIPWGMSAHSGRATHAGSYSNEGFFEVDSNIAHIDLHLCPKEAFIRKEVRVFFGLIKSHKEICSEGDLFLGTTPLKPVPVPAGKYILLFPSAYIWENEGPIEITIRSGEKTFFLLKLFSTRAVRHEDDHGGSGGGGGGGGGGGAASVPGP